MALLVYNEINRIFYFKYIHLLDKEKRNKNDMEYAIEVANGFIEYMQSIRDKCDNEVTLQSVNYWFAMKMFNM
jgi:hypothetical protein